MGAPRYDGNGFSNPLNPLSLHSENHYRDEPMIGASFMSDEKRIFGVAGVGKAGAKAGSKAGAKAGAKAGSKAAAKAASKAAAKAGSKATKNALNATKDVIKATYKSPTTKLLGAVGIVTVGGFYTFTEITGTQLFTTDCENQAAELYEKGSAEYQAYLEQCYSDNAESMGETVADIGKFTVLAGFGLLGLLIIMKR